MRFLVIKIEDGPWNGDMHAAIAIRDEAITSLRPQL
jgi:hypothetical protein